MAQQVIPVGKKLLIKQKKAQTMTESGFIIPEMAVKKECIGTVVGIGQSVEEIKMGDVIQYTEHCLPTAMKHNQEEHLLIQEGDVFAILVEVPNV
ncbi:MAG: co-chaperonin GroES (HSP10) [Arcobacteraceae bacterium]|jgi:co-chaperonin GroES (HSP10)|tara:strand:+ start:273 stop:557 length:285 start_codon:yes stop_codon:yes gene_type:complete